MDLFQKIKTVPTNPGVYLYKNAEGEVIYVGKAKNLRSRVRSYFVEGASENAKTGSLLREAVDIEYIVVANEREALALENNLIKQKKPRYNILLRDDKTYPYVKLTAERFPRVYVTRKLRKDGGTYFGPYFPANLAYRIVDLVHRNFLIPSCKIDLTREHPRPCLQFYIKRCLGPCVRELTTEEIYSEAVRDVRLLLEGKPTELSHSLRERMERAAEDMQFEMAAKYRDLIVTVEQLHEKQRMASAEGDDIDVISYHYENHLLAVNLFHMRGGKVLDRREFFWEDLGELESATGFEVGEFFSTLLKQLYLDAPYIPRTIYIPVEFEDRETLEDLLSEKRGGRVHIDVPQRGDKRSLIDLVGTNAKQSYDQRFRVMKPRADVMKSVLQDVFLLAEEPKRIECFDISHIQGAETVASMVVWEDGKMKNSEYRKFIIRTVEGIDDFKSMHEVVTRRYKRVLEEGQAMPSLVLVDGGLGQLHAAARALEELGLASQPLASIAKREEILYLFGQEDEPIVLDRHSPVLLLIQQIRDEAHRFAITFHRKRRQMRDHATELRDVPGIGELTTRRLLQHFGSLHAVKQANYAALTSVVNTKQAAAILEFFRQEK
ncbi:MAG TPA: excinuclease ABC subunit UvrC [Candidatus Saccharimonadales bacterium]|nr:excinuclease ABC subunit UvrC [Candidatus Saccharimonadales bacterium]